MVTASPSGIVVEFDCECGRSVSATAKDAGGFVQCSCGRNVSVPSLSKLRTLAGRDAYVTNPAEAIAKAIRLGQSPVGDSCLMCGAASSTVYKCEAICESTSVKEISVDRSNDIVRLLTLTSLFASSTRRFLRATRKKQVDEIEIRGHDVGANFPLPVCDSCSKSAGGVTHVKVAMQIMSQVPMYKALLDHYPQLELRVEPPISSSAR